MARNSDIAAIKLSVGSVARKSIMGKAISDRILQPLLAKLDDEIIKVSHDVGRLVVSRLRQNILNSTPHGRTYKIIEVSDGEYTEIGTYQASASGQPPAEFTGTLVNSISYELDMDGRIQVGIWEPAGTEVSTLFYRGGKLFISSDGGGHTTPVEKYSNILDVGSENVGKRPWFTEVLDDMRDEIKDLVQRSLKEFRDRASRSKKKHAVYFRVYMQELNERILETDLD